MFSDYNGIKPEMSQKVFSMDRKVSTKKKIYIYMYIYVYIYIYIYIERERERERWKSFLIS